MKNNTAQQRSLRFSITSKLSISLWFRLLAIFISLDILLCVAGFVVIVDYGERTANSIMATTDSLPAGVVNESILTVTNATGELLSGEPTGLKLPTKLQPYLFEYTREAGRKIIYLRPEGNWFYRLINSLYYQVDIPSQIINPYTYNIESFYRISISLVPILRFFVPVLLLILINQLIHLLEAVGKNRKLIRNTLKPITELVEHANSLTTQSGPYTQEEMEALVAKLDRINAARLDTRIEFDGAQDELKTLAGSINSMLARINESYRAQARFVSDASHELRTPIAAIQGYANLLDRWGKNDPNVLQESIDAIKEEAADMKDLVEQLLFLARGDNNTMPLQLETFDLANIVETVIREAKMIDGGHEFSADISTVVIEADAGLIKQALRILVDNAIKYTPAGGSIKITLEENMGSARLDVQDNGIGIPAGDVPLVFERFYRADESRARATGGTGLGLPIAKWIIDRHGGHLEVLSRQDLGTRFSIIIPARKEKQGD